MSLSIKVTAHCNSCGKESRGRWPSLGEFLWKSRWSHVEDSRDFFYFRCAECVEKLGNKKRWAGLDGQMTPEGLAWRDRCKAQDERIRNVLALVQRVVEYPFETDVHDLFREVCDKLEKALQPVPSENFPKVQPEPVQEKLKLPSGKELLTVPCVKKCGRSIKLEFDGKKIRSLGKVSGWSLSFGYHPARPFVSSCFGICPMCQGVHDDG